MYRVKSCSPNIDPCGTPLSAFLGIWNNQATTVSSLPEKHDLNKFFLDLVSLSLLFFIYGFQTPFSSTRLVVYSSKQLFKTKTSQFNYIYLILLYYYFKFVFYVMYLYVM